MSEQRSTRPVDAGVENPIDPQLLVDKPSRRMVDSTSDERTANNVMRHEYRVLNDDEKNVMKIFKDMGAAFVNQCDSVGNSRELSLAKTKMEEAVMWAVKHVTR